MMARCKINCMCYADLNQHVQQALADNTTLCVEAVGGQAMHGMLQPRLAAQVLSNYF